MRTFFKSWKRRLGVITLLLACAFTGIWIRSLFTTDTALIARPYPIFIRLDSCGGYFKWATVKNSRITTVPTNWYAGAIQKSDVEMLFDHSQFQVESSWNCCGLHFGYAIPSGIPGNGVTYFIFPYLMLAIPFTVLSTWLLLSPQGSRMPLPAAGSELQ